MKNRNNITVLSSFAEDVLLNERGRILREQKGGPAFYIEAVFNQESIGYEIPFLCSIEVEILLTKKGEFGRVKSKPDPIKLDWQSLKAPVVTISTILNEFNLIGIETYKGKVFLDIQGYVRDGSDFGKKKFLSMDVSNLFCVKGTKEEISYLPKDFVYKQKDRMLLVTNGSKGSVLYFKGYKFTAKPAKEIKSTDTIGAGDTFFAYFVVKFLQSNDQEESLKYATSKTTSFLSSKTHHHTNPF